MSTRLHFVQGWFNTNQLFCCYFLEKRSGEVLRKLYGNSTEIRENLTWHKVELKKREVKHQPKPKWLRVKLPIGDKYTQLRNLVDKYNLNTEAF